MLGGHNGDNLLVIWSPMQSLIPLIKFFFYKMTVTPALLYGVKCWAIEKREEVEAPEALVPSSFQ